MSGLSLLALLACAPEPGPPNVLIVSMDTFRADRVGRTGGDGRSLTPALDAFADGALVFESAWSQSNETLFSHTAIFTGRYPSTFGEMDYLSYRLAPDTPTLAAAFARGGYRTEAVVAGGHLSPPFGLTTGFLRYRSTGEFSTFQETAPLALEALESLAEADRPWLLFVHGYDAHSPYVKPGPLYRIETPGYEGQLLEEVRQPLFYERVQGRSWFPDFNPPQLTAEDGLNFLSPEVFAELEDFARSPAARSVPLTDGDVDFLIGSYDAAVRHADFFVGALLDELERLGLEERTIVVVLSDHGEDLLDHGYVNHRLSLHDENLGVPLMIRIPGRAPARIQSPVALVDVAGTLLELAGLGGAGGPGRSLLAPEPDRAVYSESLRGQVSVRSASGRLILPRAAAEGALPASPPPEAELLDAGGAAMPWTEAGPLWGALLTAREEAGP